MTEHGPLNLRFQPDMQSGTTAVGDWVLYDPDTRSVTRLLDRRSVLSRRAAGHVAKAQLIAANVDTLFIVTSCNADFNVARLERYVAMALDRSCLRVRPFLAIVWVISTPPLGDVI